MKYVATMFNFRFFLTAILILPALVTTHNSSAAGRSILTDPVTEEQCRACHGDSNEQPHPLLQISNANRHHLKVWEPIIGLTIYETVAPGDTTAGVYTCPTCHTRPNPESGQIEMFLTRDCLICHTEPTITGTPSSGENVHHYTEAFYNRDCEQCHSFLSTDTQEPTGNTYTYKMQRR